MQTLLLIIACAAAPAIVGPVQSQDLATQQASLVEHNSETLLLKDAPATIVRDTSPDVARARMLAQKQQQARELYPAITNYPSGTREYAEQLVGRMNDSDRHVLSLFASVLSFEQLEFATKQFAGRAQRRNEALDSHRRLLSEGHQSAGFLYPVD
jgi:hypothetical protein